MLRLASFDVVFQEIPGEVTLALNLSGCPNRCAGCHSPHLWEEVGEPLDDNLLNSLLSGYGNAITCVCFMGGDAAPGDVAHWSACVRAATEGRLKTFGRLGFRFDEPAALPGDGRRNEGHYGGVEEQGSYVIGLIESY